MQGPTCWGLNELHLGAVGTVEVSEVFTGGWVRYAGYGTVRYVYGSKSRPEEHVSLGRLGGWLRLLA